MRKFWILASLFLGLVAACETTTPEPTPEPEPQPEAPILTLTSDSLFQFDAFGGEGMLTYTIEHPTQTGVLAVRLSNEADSAWVTSINAQSYGGKKNKDKRKKALAFVDFEHWYISLEKLHRQKPNVRAWREELEKDYIVDDIYVFGDFSNPSLRAEIEKIRHVTNLIIETKNASGFYKKDFTDFIMLDNIYQSAINRSDIEAFIIFSGDGHFSSVVSFLANRCRKEVGVYAFDDFGFIRYDDVFSIL